MTRHVLLAMLFALPAGGHERDPCEKRGTSVLVDTVAHELRLCRQGRSTRTFPVAIGSGGTGKRRRGDAKTPLGTYPLGTPRASKRFGTFIPIAYPTPAQRQAGHTGGDVGVHGPARAFAWAGALNNQFDWTQGCIAVASDTEIAELAAWVRKVGAREIHLVEGDPPVPERTKEK